MGRRQVARFTRALAVQAALVGVLLVGAAAPALAAKPGHGGGKGGGGNGGGTTSTATGNDVSYPQCGTSFPTGQAFGIVGVNGGLANDLNPCLGPSSSYPGYTASELYWAVATSSGSPTQPKASLYVNTADPGNLYNGAPVADWPTSTPSDLADPYGVCATTSVATASGTATVGANTTGCAWQYGFDKATQDVAWLTGTATSIGDLETAVSIPGSPSSYPWWLDVETANTWQSGTAGQAMNVADLQGMVAALEAEGANVGVYSTAAQWDAITGGTTSASGSLAGLPDWIPGARTLSQAESNCTTEASFTGGRVALTQWAGHPVDGDYAC